MEGLIGEGSFGGGDWGVGGWFFSDDPTGVFFEVVVLTVRGAGAVEVGIIVCFGEGEDLQGAEGESLVKGMDDGADSGAGGEDVVDEEEGGMGGQVFFGY